MDVVQHFILFYIKCWLPRSVIFVWPINVVPPPLQFCSDSAVGCVPLRVSCHLPADGARRHFSWSNNVPSLFRQIMSHFFFGTNAPSCFFGNKVSSLFRKYCAVVFFGTNNAPSFVSAIWYSLVIFSAKMSQFCLSAVHHSRHVFGNNVPDFFRNICPVPWRFFQYFVAAPPPAKAQCIFFSHKDSPAPLRFSPNYVETTAFFWALLLTAYSINVLKWEIWDDGIFLEI